MSDDATVRNLVWEGCYNVRDLGGHSTLALGTTQFRAVVRSDNPERLRPPGLAALQAYGIKTVLDLRDPSEMGKEGSIRRGRLDVDIVNVSVFDFSDEIFGSRGGTRMNRPVSIATRSSAGPTDSPPR